MIFWSVRFNVFKGLVVAFALLYKKTVVKQSRRKANGISNEDRMSVVVNVARQAIRDKFESQIKTAEAKLETLKAEAETAKADIEIKAITELLAKQHEILHKLREPRK